MANMKIEENRYVKKRKKERNIERQAEQKYVLDKNVRFKANNNYTKMKGK